ncbi:V-type ATP synthase subunit I [Ruminococcus albus]|uniref:V-type ATPase 116 kDa subunit n=1 Tax=Ruminococcus albus (strain ATCC 27210 / DSM 20455 / JCM 14654 / NCDO 2250 / 7) TaxID=697329 RepID=E6UFV2_RUMA7|nr:V-type ATPase 116kDa subunit family protein [Ruminococcus albus]ADU23626.1 V-type ATPase 116 kDa subunit [Ruminococcus albus 7 = DSM 20455]
MAIEKMALVNIIGRFEDLDETLIRCCDSGCFHIEPAFRNEANSTVKLLNEKNPFGVPLKEFASLATEMGIELKETQGTRFNGWTAEQFNELSENIDSEINEKNSERQALAKEVSDLEAAVLQVDHLRGMNSDFSKIFACKHTACRIGRMPADNLAKLQYYDQTFFFVPFETTKDFCWGMYFCAESDKELVDSIFRSMFFERIRLPDYVTGNTDEALKKLDSQIKEKKAKTEALDKELAALAKKHDATILEAYTALKKRYDIFELRRKVGAVKEKFYIKGFVPKKQADKFSEKFGDMDEVEVVLLPPDADAYVTPPTVLKNSWFTRPFAMLVEMYGLPKYNGFNPTAFVAITYTLLFGIMFGDLGQGLLLFLGGLILGRKSKQAGGIVARCGLSSMIFGTLYGSVFGFEELLDPIYESFGIDFLPLKIFKQSTFILLTAVGIGIFLILVSMLINIYIGFKEKNYEKAIFGCNGIAGLVFYASVCTGVICTIMLKIEVMSLPFKIFLIAIPLICIFCRVPFSIAVKYKKWKLSEDEEDMTIGGFIVENFFEMFEFLLSYVSNTMSFLRVGGFVLSHAGMMMVVMTLMNMANSFAMKPVTLVIGNLFVMAMEGMIVAIQIIRLEFYEVFSRFYESDGKEFVPMSVSFDTEVNI